MRPGERSDSAALREAVRVLRARSSRERSFWLEVVCRVLLTAARRIDEHDGQEGAR